MPRYRPPRDCPVCSSRLQLTQLGCPNCGTGLSGTFESCEFCGLEDAERAMLRVFLSSRGNMKELERQLGVSYPTARSRFEDLLRKLGLTAPVPSSPSSPETPQPLVPGDGTDDPRLDLLRAVAAGRVEVDQARDALTHGTPDPRNP